MSGWNEPIGPVVVKKSHGRVEHFKTLVDGINGCRFHTIVEDLSDDLHDGPLRPIYLAVILDSLGMVVPLWRIEQEMQGRDIDPLRPVRRKWLGYDPERDFRNGPVPFTRRRRTGRYFRHVKTLGEMRDLQGLEAELEDTEEYPFRLKLRSRRKKLPTLWDDIMIAKRGRSWKHHRKTQYKGAPHA